MDDALGGMQALLSRLEAPPADAAGLAADARRAQNGIARWLLAVPAADVAAVDSLYKAVRMADSDRNGQLSEAELATLPAEQASVWRAKVALVGE